jgi:hypothetical protein
MCSLLKQVLGRPGVEDPPGFETFWKTHMKKGTRPEMSELEGMFKLAVKPLSTFYLILDAFDECTVHQQPKIKDLTLRLSQLPNIKIMVTGRPHINFLQNDEFDKACTLEIKADEGDVQKYLSRELVNAKQSPRIKEKIMDELSGQVDGTYPLFL